jgi:hypothetical protein
MAPRKVKKKQETHWAIAAVVAIVLFGTWFVWQSRAPEHVSVVSDDQVVTVQGKTRAATPLMIEHVEDAVSFGDGFVSDLYEVSFADGGQLVDGEVVMVLGSELDLTELVVYTYDPSVMDWVALPTVFDLTLGYISSELTVLDSAVIVAGERVDIE